MSLAILLLAAAAVCGCMSYDVRAWGTFDASHKTITVDPGGSGLLGIVKTALRENGWKLKVDAGPTVVEKDERKTMEYDTFNSRYRMGLREDWEDHAIVGGSIYHYDITIIDNQTGEEVLTMSGRGIDRDIASRLVQGIKANSR